MPEQQRQKPVYICQDLEVDLARRELRVSGAPVHLGGRAFEIIEVLVEAGGETVSKYDLMDRVWPGAIVEENTLQFHISAARKALGDSREVLKTVFGKGYRLLGDWTIREEGAAVSKDALDRPFLNNLPASVFPLIGRDAAVKEVADSLSAYRIVTLTGPGGVGKTMLALEVARSLFPSFQGDAALVELASLSDPDLVPSAVATSLEQQLGGDRISPRSVAQSIAHRKFLLVLDNCEHLINAAAALTETLVRMCPGASVLVTSREPLRIEGESVYSVPPLDVPPLDRDASDALQHSAVQLFMARTRHTSASCRQAENLAEVAAICRDLDGIPLALEFAAARAVTLGVQYVAAGLNDRFRLLSRGHRTALPRHQTLRATLDWSYELLSDSEKYLLRHLAVLPGGFTIEAAAAMTGGRESNTDIEERIDSLVWKSLVTLVGTASNPRWRLLESIRAYAFDKLAENGEAQQAARRQAEFLRDLFASGRFAPLVTLDDLPRYAREIDNVRAALDWTFSLGGNKAVGIALTAAYAPVWLNLSLLAECRERVERARVNLPTASALSPGLKAQLLTVVGIVAVYTGTANEGSQQALAEALEIAESLDDPEAQLQAIYAIWIQRFNNGEHHAAQSLADRFAAIAPGTGDPADTLVADRLLGTTEHYGGNQRKAQQHYESLLDRHTEPSGSRRAMWVHYDGRVLPQARLARILWVRGFAPRALQVAQTSLEDAEHVDHKLSICFALGEALCPLYLLAGDIEAATRCVTMLSGLAAQHGFGFWVRSAHCLEAVLLIKRGEASQGSKLLRSAFEDFNNAGQALHCSGYVGDFVQALVHLGSTEEASSVLENALSRARQETVLWHVPELLRMKGELLLRQADDQSLPHAEQVLLEAIEVARTQAALFWELRAAVSLAGLKIRQGEPAAAREILTQISQSFSADTKFLDLETARQLLSELPAGSPGKRRRGNTLREG